MPWDRRCRASRRFLFTALGHSEIGVQFLKAPRTAHRAMVARLAARFHRTFLFAFEELHHLGHGCFFYAESFLTGMSGRAGKIANPGRMSCRHKLRRL